MIKKFFFLFLIFILWVCSLQAIPKFSCIDNGQEAKILETFLRMGIEEEEYGYILEGAKPISIRNFYGLDSFPISKQFNREEDELRKTLLVRSAIPIWNKFCSSQKKFVLKALPLSPSEPITSGLEVFFINIDKLNEVIKKNIHLFRYILGPNIQPQQLVNEIAYSNKRLIDILQEDLVLIGIVLGFGSHNSLTGGRIEEIFSSSFSKDYPLFPPKSQLMEEKENHNLSLLLKNSYGYDYLEFAGGNHDIFSKKAFFPFPPHSNFSSIKEELLTLDSLVEPLPSCLYKEYPKFIFNAYKGGASNQPLFKQLIQVQKRIQKLLKHPNFFKEVLKKIGIKKFTITTSKNVVINTSFLLNTLDEEQWRQVLLSIARQFEEKKDRAAFFQAFLSPCKSSEISPKIIGASREILKGLKKALHHLESADAQFKILSSDPSMQVVVPSKLYFRITHPGSGKKLEKNNRIRLGYIMEDSHGKVLFANYDTWISLSETIPGFAHGIQGMKLGEKRTLFVHPALGYGVLTTLPPCIGLTIKVHLIDIDDNSHGILPSLLPLELDWIRDPSFYRDIEESIEQRSRFIGSFYRKMLDKIQDLDKAILIDEISKQVEKI